MTRRTPKLQHEENLWNSAAAINYGQLGQLKGEEQDQMFEDMMVIVGGSVNDNLGEGTNLIIAEVAKALTSTAACFGAPFVDFFDSQLGYRYANGVIEVLEDLELTEDWVVLRDREDGQIVCGTKTWYEGRLAELQDQSRPAWNRGDFGGAVAAMLQARIEAERYEVVCWIESSVDGAAPTLDQALLKKAEEEEARIAETKMRREARQTMMSLGDFCVCGACDSCRARTASVSPAELAGAMAEIKGACCEGYCPTCIAAAQELVIQTRTAAEAEAAAKLAAAEALEVVADALEGASKDAENPEAAAVLADMAEEVREVAEEVTDGEATVAEAEEVIEAVATLCECGDCDDCRARVTDAPPADAAEELAEEATDEAQAEAEAELEEGVEALVEAPVVEEEAVVAEGDDSAAAPEELAPETAEEVVEEAADEAAEETTDDAAGETSDESGSGGMSG